MCLHVDVEEHELGDLGEPANYKAALLDPESEKWLNAMKVEMQSMRDNKVWDLVDLPPNRKTVGSKWLFKKKTNMDDDILIMGNNILMLQDVKSYLGSCFAMKDLGEAAYILGIKIYRDRSKQLIGLCQSAYIEKILKRYFMENSKRRTVPMQKKLKLSKSQEAVWIQKFIYGLDVVPTIEEPINMYCGNNGAIATMNDHGITKGARHFHAKVYCLRETIEMGDVRIEKVDTYDNLADPFTKALAFLKHSELTKKIGIITASSLILFPPNSCVFTRDEYWIPQLLNIYFWILFMTEKLHQEKAQQEKLKAVKARLNFEEASQYSESESSNKRRNLKERLGPRDAQTRSGSPEQRHSRSKSPRENGLERRTMFKRLEKGVFHRLGDKENNKSKPKKQKSSMEDDLSQPWVCEEMDPFTPRIHYFDFPKTRMPSHIKTYDGSEDLEDHLKIFQAAAKTERWAMPTWCHMFNSTLTRNARGEQRMERKQDRFTLLTKTPRENLALDKGKFKPPPPMTTPVKKGMPASSKRSGKDNKRRGNLEERQTAGEEDGTEGLIIIEAQMGGHCVHCIYVDGGSFSEILYEHCFSKFCPEIKNQLIPANTPLVGFSREIIWPLGHISLLVRVGDEEHSTSAWMNFMVVRSPSPYNGIIGRPGIRKIRAIPYTLHGMIKFPMTGGIVTLQSSRIIPLECSMVSEQ
nr:reverse transcriptase domain-containing protein [Tanacetum cinerariifolium]